MDKHDIGFQEAKETGNPEKMKIRDLVSSLEKSPEEKKPLTVQEADERVEKRLEEDGIVEDKLNKRSDVSFGRTTGCASFCRKTHDATNVHGTY